MIKLYSFVGGRKMFIAYLAIAILFVGGIYMEEHNYNTFESGLFAIYATLVAGNVGKAWVDSRSNNTMRKTTITNETQSDGTN